MFKPLPATAFTSGLTTISSSAWPSHPRPPVKSSVISTPHNVLSHSPVLLLLLPPIISSQPHLSVAFVATISYSDTSRRSCSRFSSPGHHCGSCGQCWEDESLLRRNATADFCLSLLSLPFYRSICLYLYCIFFSFSLSIQFFFYFFILVLVLFSSFFLFFFSFSSSLLIFFSDFFFFSNWRRFFSSLDELESYHYRSGREAPRFACHFLPLHPYHSCSSSRGEDRPGQPFSSERAVESHCIV